MFQSVAISSLVYDKTRLIVGTLGVAFAVLLVFVNLGFLGALKSTAGLLYNQLDADIYLISPLSLNGTATNAFPRDRLYQAATAPGIQSAVPLYVSALPWRNVQSTQQFYILAFGFNPNDQVFLLPELQEATNIAALNETNTVLFDRRSLPKYGPQTLGLISEAGGRRIRIGGFFNLGGGLAAEGTIIMSDQNFLRFFDPRPIEQIDLGLLKLQPHVSLDSTLTSLRKILPTDVEIYSKAEIIARDQTYWLETTAVGFIFSLGVFVSLVVGASIVYQILYADIAKYLREYATLKAIGFQNSFLLGVVLQEALCLACLGYVPGVFIAYGFYQLILKATSNSIPMTMEVSTMTMVAGLTLVMCSLSALISVRRVFQADPADAF